MDKKLNFKIFATSLFLLSLASLSDIAAMKREFVSSQNEFEKFDSKRRKVQSDQEEGQVSKKGFVFHFFEFGKEKAPQFLKDAWTSLQSVSEDAESLTLSWEYRGGYFYLGALYTNNESTFFSSCGKIGTLNDFICTCNRLENYPESLVSCLGRIIKDAQIKVRDGENTFTTYKRMLASCYKIHLMPTVDDFDKILVRLFNEFLENPEFRSLISTVKIHKRASYYVQDCYDKKEQFFPLGSDADDSIFLSEANEKLLGELSGYSERPGYFPMIVIYPIFGKENAQVVLNKIKDLFEGYEGLDVELPFNQKVTPLIHYAQGNSDDKICEDLSDYFEQPGMVHYQSGFTGQELDHRLTF